MFKVESKEVAECLQSEIHEEDPETIRFKLAIFFEVLIGMLVAVLFGLVLFAIEFVVRNAQNAYGNSW